MFLPTFVLKNHVDFITQDLLGELTPESLMADFLLQLGIFPGTFA